MAKGRFHKSESMARMEAWTRWKSVRGVASGEWRCFVVGGLGGGGG